jgi:hypothetical protein
MKDCCPLLVVIAGSFLLVPFGIVPAALLQRELDFRSLFYVNVGAAVAQAAVALGLAAAGFSAMSLAWAVVAQQGARAVLGQWRSGRRPDFSLSLRDARPIVRFGSGASLLSMTGALGVRTPELIIGRLISISAVGLWGRAMGLAGHLRQLVSGAIGGVFYPAFARIRDSGEDLGAALSPRCRWLQRDHWPPWPSSPPPRRPLVFDAVWRALGGGRAAAGVDRSQRNYLSRPFRCTSTADPARPHAAPAAA